MTTTTTSMAYLLRRKGLGKTSCEAIQALSTTGITAYRNDQELPQDPDALCIRWGTTSNVPQKKVLNTAKAIHTVANKMEFRRVLQEHHLCPTTWFPGNFVPKNLEVIVRPSYHSQGNNLQHTNSQEGFDVPQGYYASEYIPKVAEYRVFIVSGRVVCVAQKTVDDPTQIAWNVAKGGKFTNVKWSNWPLGAIYQSLGAFSFSGLDFGGVDVMLGPDGTAYILEINSACSLTSPYRQQCFTNAFDYIVREGKQHFLHPLHIDGWRDVIHPGIMKDKSL